MCHKRWNGFCVFHHKKCVCVYKQIYEIHQQILMAFQHFLSFNIKNGLLSYRIISIIFFFNTLHVIHFMLVFVRQLEKFVNISVLSEYKSMRIFFSGVCSERFVVRNCNNQIIFSYRKNSTNDDRRMAEKDGNREGRWYWQRKIIFVPKRVFCMC